MTQVEKVCIETLLAMNAGYSACVTELQARDPKRTATVLRITLGQIVITMRRLEGAMREDSARGSRAKS
jgi:hypothetical protein